MLALIAVPVAVSVALGNGGAGPSEDATVPPIHVGPPLAPNGGGRVVKRAAPGMRCEQGFLVYEPNEPHTPKLSASVRAPAVVACAGVLGALCAGEVLSGATVSDACAAWGR